MDRTLQWLWESLNLNVIEETVRAAVGVDHNPVMDPNFVADSPDPPANSTFVFEPISVNMGLSHSSNGDVQSPTLEVLEKLLEEEFGEEIAELNKLHPGFLGGNKVKRVRETHPSGSVATTYTNMPVETLAGDSTPIAKSIECVASWKTMRNVGCTTKDADCFLAFLNRVLLLLLDFRNLQGLDKFTLKYLQEVIKKIRDTIHSYKKRQRSVKENGKRPGRHGQKRDRDRSFKPSRCQCGSPMAKGGQSDSVVPRAKRQKLQD